MPRFRRQLPLVHELKEQIRGGIAYKVSFLRGERVQTCSSFAPQTPLYDALRTSPTLPLDGHIKKREVHRIKNPAQALLR
jgi:hypothetical protein